MYIQKNWTEYAKETSVLVCLLQHYLKNLRNGIKVCVYRLMNWYMWYVWRMCGVCVCVWCHAMEYSAIKEWNNVTWNNMIRTSFKRKKLGIERKICFYFHVKVKGDLKEVVNTSIYAWHFWKGKTRDNNQIFGGHIKNHSVFRARSKGSNKEPWKITLRKQNWNQFE